MTSVGAVSDRTLNRAIATLALLLGIGLPAIGLVYYADRHVERGPSIVERTIVGAEEAVRAEPNKLSNRLALAAAYAANGRQADAVDQYGQVIEAEPGNEAALLGRGDALRELDQLDASAQDYQKLVETASQAEMAMVDARLEGAYYGLGVIALQQDRPRDAATNFADALTIDRTDADALNLMGTALIAIGDMTNAVDALRDAVALVPTGWCEPYAQMGQAYGGLGDADGAAYASGMVALCEGRSADAEQQLAQLTEGAYARDALIGLALVAEERGDVEAAIFYYGRVYTSDPTDFAALGGLGRLGAVPSAAPAPQVPVVGGP